MKTLREKEADIKQNRGGHAETQLDSRTCSLLLNFIIIDVLINSCVLIFGKGVSGIMRIHDLRRIGLSDYVRCVYKRGHASAHTINFLGVAVLYFVALEDTPCMPPQKSISFVRCHKKNTWELFALLTCN